MNKKFVDTDQQCFAFTPQANFPPIIWIFIEGEGDGIKSSLPFKIFSTLVEFVLSKKMGTRNLLQMERVFMRIDVRFSQSLAGGKIATILDNGSCFWLYTLHKAVCFHKILSGHNSDPWPLYRSSDAQILLSLCNRHTNVTERRVNVRVGLIESLLFIVYFWKPFTTYT